MQIFVSEQGELAEVLKRLHPDGSSAARKRALQQGRVLVNGVVQKHGTVHPGDRVDLLPKRQPLEEGVLLLYADRDIAVIDKPSGLLSVATDHGGESTAFRVLKRHFRNHTVFVVHRLDRETSGLMVFALSKRGLEGLKALFSGHRLERRYVALVHGAPSPLTGTWESHLWEDSSFHVHIDPTGRKGKRAVTHFSCENPGVVSRLDLQLETGRKHQIRVQCSAAGCPVLGDRRYGGKGDSRRLMLHAHRLLFLHPLSQKPLEFLSPLPEGFNLQRGAS